MESRKNGTKKRRAGGKHMLRAFGFDPDKVINEGGQAREVKPT